MYSNTGKNLRSRIGEISELENIVDGSDIEGYENIKKTLIEVPQKNITSEKETINRENDAFEIRKALINAFELQLEKLEQINDKIKKLENELNLSF
jgi:hypothetical protein